MTILAKVALAIQHEQMVYGPDYDRLARAAMAAMREPSQAMLDATGEMGVPDQVYADIWQAMIDAALKKP